MTEPVTVYAAKCFWPGVTEQEVEQAGARAAAEAMRAYQSGNAIAYLGSIVFPADELVLCLFEGRSRDAIQQTTERAGIPAERIMESVWMPKPPGARPSGAGV